MKGLSLKVPVAANIQWCWFPWGGVALAKVTLKILQYSLNFFFFYNFLKVCRIFINLLKIFQKISENVFTLRTYKKYFYNFFKNLLTKF